MSNVEGMYSVNIIKKIERSDTTLQHSIFDILRFCGSLFPGSAADRSCLQRDSQFDSAAFDRLRPRACRGELVADCCSAVLFSLNPEP